MEIAAIAIIAVVALAFLAALAGLGYAGFKLFMNQQETFFKKLSESEASHQAERSASQEAYAKFLELQEEREQIIDQADKEWLASPESAVVMDDDLDWEVRDG